MFKTQKRTRICNGLTEEYFFRDKTTCKISPITLFFGFISNKRLVAFKNDTPFSIAHILAIVCIPFVKC
jgi:hypothetical protein